MFEKIVAIKNVGRFLSLAASSDMTFKRHNLIFAENGRGKTKFSFILRLSRSVLVQHFARRPANNGQLRLETLCLKSKLDRDDNF